MAAVFRFSRQLPQTTGSLMATCIRNLGMASVLMAKADKNTDPIQKLFAEKLQEYKKKSAAAGDELVDFTPEKKAKMEVEMDQIRNRFGEGDLEKFPKFDFEKASA
ncbi:ATP synthase-coupling factor 6, mitochondrial-like [Stylophora pistillata]|uniref:ATP synthase-coupling factor 6, mitochondrial-like n=1 Tax=Stylophora pistillata TaxID=50429 RepID=UPI000C040429|nr:ATP synthase-coupling factor 6, mitochondrial-like [Stylophora pistillata]